MPLMKVAFAEDRSQSSCDSAIRGGFASITARCIAPQSTQILSAAYSPPEGVSELHARYKGHNLSYLYVYLWFFLLLLMYRSSFEFNTHISLAKIVWGKMAAASFNNTVSSS